MFAPQQPTICHTSGTEDSTGAGMVVNPCSEDNANEYNYDPLPPFKGLESLLHYAASSTLASSDDSCQCECSSSPPSSPCDGRECSTSEYTSEESYDPNSILQINHVCT